MKTTRIEITCIIKRQLKLSFVVMDMKSFGCSAFQSVQQVASDPLAGVDKDHTDVLMYCTGGIRRDVYSTILR